MIIPFSITINVYINIKNRFHLESYGKYIDKWVVFIVCVINFINRSHKSYELCVTRTFDTHQN